jgi:hypothetical protein
MNQPDLDSILKRARLPKIPDESLELFPRRIVANLKHDPPPNRPARKFVPQLCWALGVTGCVFIAFAIVHWSGWMKIQSLPEGDSLRSPKLIRETLGMFPNRVRAIVQDTRGISLILSDNDDVPASPPLYIRICDGKNCSSFVTFSGQEIQMADQEMTVLADANGGIILTGNQFAWSSTEPPDAGLHLKIEARNLGATAM